MFKNVIKLNSKFRSAILAYEKIRAFPTKRFSFYFLKCSVIEMFIYYLFTVV